MPHWTRGKTLSRRRVIGAACGVTALNSIFRSSLGAQQIPRPSVSRRPVPQDGAIDVHAHFFPEGFVKSLAEEGGAPGGEFDISTPAAPVLVIGTARLALDLSYWDLERRLDRFFGCATLPIQDPALALRGIDRLAAKLVGR